MSLLDIIKFFDLPEVTSATTFIIIVVIILTTLVQISPLKLNPWDFCLGWIGDRLNSHIIKKVDVLDEKLTEHVKESKDSSVKRKRQRILQFVEDGMGGKRYTKETFEFMMNECDEYEKYIKDNDIKNGVIDASIAEIRRRYIDHIHNADFADLGETTEQIKALQK
jgi:hypothetical protein